MSKFVLDCEAVQEICITLSNIESQMTEMSSIVSSYSISDSEEFDFFGAITSISKNIKRAATKIGNTVNLFNKVVGTHTEVQNGITFEPNINFSSVKELISEKINSGQNTIKHVVTSKDNLSNLATKYGTTVAAIVAANNIANRNLIHTNDTLIIPVGKNVKSSDTNRTPSLENTIENNPEPTTNLGTGKVINIPKGLGKVHTYMGWQLITSKSSQQYKLREAAGTNFDSEGFGKIDGRYVVATTTTFGKVGDYVDFEQADGSVIKCIIGDIKNQNDRNCNSWGHNNGQTIVEFVVDKNSWYGTGHSNPGTSNCHPEWHQTITKATNYGNYFDKM